MDFMHTTISLIKSNCCNQFFLKEQKKTCLVLEFLAVGSILTGYFLPYWLTYMNVDISYGLWFARVCVADVCQSMWYTDHPYLTPTFPLWDVIRAFETVAVITGFISLVFGGLSYRLRHRFDIYRPASKGLFIASALISGFTALVGMVVLMSLVERSNVRWCPALSFGGGFLAVSMGVYTLFFCQKDPYTRPTRRIGESFPTERLSNEDSELLI